jgi:hypothetical protein
MSHYPDCEELIITCIRTKLRRTKQWCGKVEDVLDEYENDLIDARTMLLTLTPLVDEGVQKGYYQGPPV